MSNTGLFRVNKVKSPSVKQGYRWAYQTHNELVDIDIRKVNLLDLKKEVIRRGLLWGIVDIEKTIQVANEQGIDVIELEGVYGQRMTFALQLQMKYGNENEERV